MSPWFGLVIMLGLAAFYFRAAQFENLSYPALWGGGSCLLYLFAIYGLDWGVCGALALQLALLFVMGGKIHGGSLYQELMARRLRQHEFEDGKRCPNCGYDLRGSPRAETCPECGEVLSKSNG